MSTDYNPDTKTYVISGIEDDVSREHDCPARNGARVVVAGTATSFICPLCGETA